MDVPSLLTRARARSGVSQRELARRSGVSKAALTTYESGTSSPTVAVLDRLLAACGLQVPDRLEPVTAHVDAVLEQWLSGSWRLDVEQVERVARSLEDRVEQSPPGLRMPRQGPVTWALDGESALAAHGLAAEHAAPQVVVLLDEACRWWLQAVGLQGTDQHGFRSYESWLEVAAERLVPSLQGLQVCRLGLLQVRVVEDLPPPLQMTLARADPPEGPAVGRGLEVPVLPLHEVEAAHPHLAKALRRHRDRTAAA